jgi:hypothetical protein
LHALHLHYLLLILSHLLLESSEIPLIHLFVRPLVMADDLNFLVLSK